ncbi:MAG: AI-2E family transporter [Clostridia bacterium]|nr:AI-2E family transporter [Clostridia bacterium]
MKKDERRAAWRSIRKYVLIVAAAILLYELLEHWEAALAGIKWFLGLFAPLLGGIAVAFVVNMPMRFLERLWRGKKNRGGKIVRPVCMIAAYLVVIAIVTGLGWLIIPRLYESVETLALNFSDYYAGFKDWAEGILNRLNLSEETINSIAGSWNSIAETVTRGVTALLPEILQFTVDLTSGVFSGVMALMISGFTLYNKEKLIRQLKSFLRACLSEKRAERLIEIGSMTNVTLNKFILGQLTEAGILGVLAFVGMQIMGIPYSLLISVVLAFTALVPIVGPIVGTVPCAFIVLMIDPGLAVVFVIFIIVLQQLEGNLIYPRVVGNAIGLSGLWVLLAVILGGGLFGVAGVLLGVPLMAVIYRLVGEWVRERNRKKALAKEQKEEE